MLSFWGKGSLRGLLANSVMKSLGVVGIVSALSIGGHQYVKSNVAEVYHVYMGDKQLGIVSNPEIVEKHILTAYKNWENENPEIHMVLNSDEIIYKNEKVFGLRSNDQTVLEKLDGLLTVKTVGVAIKVDGKLMGIVKDQETANQILEEIKNKYVPEKIESSKKNGLTVSILSVPDKSDQSGDRKIISAGFVENVQLNSIEARPNELNEPNEILRKLQMGDVKPTSYTVQQGDCVSCIAKKLGITKQVIYNNNPSIEDDKIKIGQQLNVTALQPALTIKTVEKIVENQDVDYDTKYESDDNLRKGETQTIRPGKKGLKKVSLVVTKTNGDVQNEEQIDEEIIEEPVSAVVKRGTKVIQGEGSGKFIWPVIGARMTSTFGMRWGKMHEGVDLVGNKNILAADNGVVVFAGNKNDGYGNCIIIDHKNGYRTLYGHLSKIYVTSGKIVEKGEKIGYMGSTGESTGVHLHFGVLKNGNYDNPMKYLSR